MAKLNVLVIDDDPNIRKLLTDLLSGRSEFRLMVAGDGKEAVRCFVEEDVHVVLTDIHMPGFTGLELVADMQKVKFKPEVLVMTANATPENVETARRVGARAVIIKPFDDLSVVESEIAEAVKAAAEAASRRNGDRHGAAAAAPGPPAAPAPPRGAPAPAARPAPAAVRAAAPPRPAPKAPAPVPVPPSDMPDLDTWQGAVTGNETPPPAPQHPARPPAAPAAPPAAAAPAPRPAPTPARPAVPAPQAARPAQVPAARPAAPARPPSPPPEPAAAPAEDDLNFDDLREIADAPMPEPAAAPPPPRGDVAPPLPPEMEDVFRVEASLDIGRMKMQVPIVCLQTWEEKSAVQALRRLAAETRREFCTWSAAKGLMKDDEQPMGDMYRDPARALEYIRRQKNRGVYVLADFRQCLEERTVVRLLREMVMELQTAHTMLVLTAPRLPVPPELSPLCVTFDWPQGEGSDLETLVQEVETEVSSATGRPIRLDASARMQLLEQVRDMPSARARFEIARALMARAKGAR